MSPAWLLISSVAPYQMLYWGTPKLGLPHFPCLEKSVIKERYQIRQAWSTLGKCVLSVLQFTLMSLIIFSFKICSKAMHSIEVSLLGLHLLRTNCKVHAVGRTERCILPMPKPLWWIAVLEEMKCTNLVPLYFIGVLCTGMKWDEDVSRLLAWNVGNPASYSCRSVMLFQK